MSALVADGVESHSFHVTGPEAITGDAVAQALTEALAAARGDRNALTAGPFDALDTDRDGKLSRAELGAYLGQHGYTPGEVDAVLAAADADGDGVIEALGRPPRPIQAWCADHVAAFVPTHWEGLRTGDEALRPSSVG